MPFRLIGDTPEATREDIRAGVSARLQLARARAGLSQQTVAQWLDLHQPSAAMIEMGTRSVRAEELVLLARLYGVSVQWLACGG